MRFGMAVLESAQISMVSGPLTSRELRRTRTCRKASPPDGIRADGTPYAAIIRRRCLDCGQVRIDKEYM